MIASPGDVKQVEIGRRSFMARAASPDTLKSRSVVATAIAESPDKPYLWAVGLFLDNTKLSMEFWTRIAGISGFGDKGGYSEATKLNDFGVCSDFHIVGGWL
jgi:hypothetical protein